MYIVIMNTPKLNTNYLMIRLPNFSQDNAKIIKSIARGKRMPVGAYVASVLEREIKKEIKKEAMHADSQ